MRRGRSENHTCDFAGDDFDRPANYDRSGRPADYDRGGRSPDYDRSGRPADYDRRLGD